MFGRAIAWGRVPWLTVGVAAAVCTLARAEPLGTAFTYQGRVEKNGTPVTGVECDFRFGLWDALAGGSQQGASPQTVADVPVEDGLFTAVMDFGPNVFQSQARWLEIEVQCPGDGGFVLLSPRVELTAAPSALDVRLPYSGIASTAGNAFSVINNGAGGAGWFEITAGGGAYSAVSAASQGDGPAIYGYNIGTGRAARFDAVNSTSTSDALFANTSGLGHAGTFAINNPDNSEGALYATTSGTGPAIDAYGLHGSGVKAGSGGAAPAVFGYAYGSGPAGWFHVDTMSSDAPALYATTTGTGPAIQGDGLIESLSDGFKFPDGTIQTTAAAGGGNFWSLTGNAGTTPGTDFLGTTDNQALEVHVNGQRALRIEPHATSPNVIAGHFDNTVSPGVFGATIAGGGVSDGGNKVTDYGGTVGGGRYNQAGDAAGTTSDKAHATVGGGLVNSSAGMWSVIAGGSFNTATGEAATISGGGSNSAQANYATVSGGVANVAAGDQSTVGGGNDNEATGVGSIVGGGNSNSATGDGGTVGGGYYNIASGYHTSTVAGGYSNTASGSRSTVAGGYVNTASGLYSSVPGGAWNLAGGHYSLAAGQQARVRDATTVGGGDTDGDQGTFVWADSTNSYFTSTGPDQFLVRAAGGVGINTNAPGQELDVNGDIHASGTIASGSSIVIDGTAGSEKITSSDDLELHVAAGRALRIETNATSPNMVGGYSGNLVASGVRGATISGGGSQFDTNNVSDDYGTVGGGGENQAGDFAGVTNDAMYATVGGGYINTASGGQSTVSGGWNNTASGDQATVPGGYLNEGSGNYSFAAGRQAKAGHAGAFVWADSTNADFASERNNQFRVRADGGARFDDGARWVNIRDDGVDLITTSTGAHLTLGGLWTDSSDRALKQDIEPIDARDVLQRVDGLSISTWRYEVENASVRHMGPMAQDFSAAFGLGNDDRHIASLDTGGVALAAIQGLYEIVKEKDCEIEDLKDKKADLEARVAALEAMMSKVLASQNGGGR